MSHRTTPLGFLPVDLELHSHCMLVYAEKNEAFIRAVEEYLTAGLQCGEMCLCYLPSPWNRELEQRMVGKGQPGQLRVVCEEGFIGQDNRVDAHQARLMIAEVARRARTEFGGLRTYGDRSSQAADRLSRLKWLESEALIGANMPTNITLCGFEASAVPRSYLLQARSLHPYIASLKGVHSNGSVLTASQFLAGFYRYKKLAKTFPGTPDGLAALIDQFEDTAARTPLDLTEVHAFVDAIRDTLAELQADSGVDTSHVRLVLVPSKECFSAMLKFHRLPGSQDPREIEPSAQLGEPSDVIRTFSVEKGDLVVTLTRRYGRVLQQWRDMAFSSGSE